MSRVQNTFQFWNAVEELAAEAQQQQNRASYISTGLCNSNHGDGRSSSQGDFSSQSTVTSVKTQNWRKGASSSDEQQQQQQQLGFDQRCRAEASPTSVDRSSSPSAFFLPSSTSQHLAMAPPPYLSSSHHHTDPSLQTLYLMDPSHHHSHSFANATNNNLFHPSPVAEFGNFHLQQQNNIVRFPNSAASSSSSPTMAMLHHQQQLVSVPTDVYSAISRQGHGHMYNWGTAGGLGSALQFHGGADENNQAIMDSVKLSAASSDYGGRALVAQQYHEQTPFLSAPGHGITAMDGLQASAAGAGQILSLSLSPQQANVNNIQQPLQQQSYSLHQHQQQPDAGFFHGDSQYKAGILSEKPLAGPNALYTDNFLSATAGGYQSALPSGQINIAMGARETSKYLRPAQELLNEIVSVGIAMKASSVKLSHSQPWITSASEDPSVSRDKSTTSEVSDKLMIEAKKEAESVVAGGAMTSTAAAGGAAGSEQRTESNIVELTSAERQDLQEKRAKLIAMRDEVDRRYRQYYHQMQNVITSFESAAGIGAATTYTSLALQTISKHFRCLRDAITGQIQVASKALGDEDSSGFVKGETSKLRLIGQQLRQQRVLRQLGMMQQQAWRPQRGLPEHSVSILRAWLFEHFLHPYPKDADKILLARQTGLTRSQVSNWFINARVRLWKPMVEEMYLEEIKEAEGNGEDRSVGEDGEVSQGVTDAERSKPVKQAKTSDESHDSLHGKGYPSDALHGKGSPADNILFSEESIRQGVMKAKNVLQNSLTPAVNPGVTVDDAMEQEMKIRTDGNYREPYGIPQNNGFLQTDHLNLPGYGSYQINNLNRYSQEAFPGAYPGNGGISLTLGLQHFEGSSFSGSYGEVQTHVPTVRHEEGTNVPIGYYAVNDSSLEALGLQNRKPFAAHMLRHDFVV